MPRRRCARHRPGRPDLAGGRHRPRARRRAAVHRTAVRRQRRRHRRAPHRRPAPEPRWRRCSTPRAAAGVVFGVDLAARDTATVGGMASTNAGGLRTVRYGNMGEQVVGLDVALPDGSVLRRHSRVRSDNTGYDLPALFVGAEGTLGVITALDLRLHPTPSHRVTAVCGFADLEALVEAGRSFRDVDGIAALELIDGRAAALTGEHLGVARAGGGRLAAAGGAGRRPRPDRPARRSARGRAACATSPRSAWISLRSNGCGVFANRVRRGAGRLRAAAEVRRVVAVVGDQRIRKGCSRFGQLHRVPEALPVLVRSHR